MTTATLAGPTALYRFFDDTDTLLYVGITYDPPKRFLSHEGDKPWRLVARISVEWHETRPLADIAERTAIRAEVPLWNKARPLADGTWIGIGRPSWEPKTDEERIVLVEAARLRRVVEEAEAAVWVNLARGRQLNIPDTTLCDVSGESRATLNRRFGSKRASDS